ncbi:MAG: hypothetical protein A3F13_04985 [Gammaproteobacteria bacterium RIFCSPHIGHO2_12_FULL_40_19]|nr:MAG: hypothetical protein A3F13_04985 [Gammaproteobacteria bacterium RIFCSPHIGHO2_12_FULL_40_19]
MKSNLKIAVIGLWHLGCVTAACLASLGHDVIALDSREIIDQCYKGILPIQEPGLAELIKKHNLLFSDDFSKIADVDFIYITFDIPVDQNDQIDLTIIYDSFNKIIPLLNEKTIIIISSQIPVGTSDILLKKLRALEKQNEICYIPENLKLGAAIDAFLFPERIVFGISSKSIKNKITDLFQKIDAKHFFMDLKSAEMTKHALNTYLATLICWSSEISDLCEATGANAVHVMQAIKAEERVSEKAPIMPGLGFGGGTLARDIQILRAVGKEKKVKTDLLNVVIQTNTERMHYIQNKLIFLLSSLSGKTIAFLGLTYKANTSTLRRSLALQIIDQLQGDVLIKAYDPTISGKIKSHPRILICDSIIEAAKNSDALIITTDWDEFKTFNYSQLVTLMKTPLLLDTKNMLNIKNIKGMQYHGIGI